IENAVAVGLVAPVAPGVVVAKLGKQAASLYLRRDLQPDSTQNRGHQIGERNRIGNCACRGILRQPILWQSNDQRHMHRSVVDKESVRLFAMLSQAFTMVAAEHDYRVLINPFLFQKPEKPPN